MTCKRIFLLFLFVSGTMLSFAQAIDERDTFFLAKKKGLLGKLGKSISRSIPPLEPVRIVNPFTAFKGKTIRNIDIMPLGFNRNIHDTDIVKKSFGIRIANALHRDTRIEIIRNHLLFKEGDRVMPLLLADNEHFLRNQEFIQDARIIVYNLEGYENSVNVLVLTKDVFSIGGSLTVNNKTRGKAELREDNLGGSGNKLAFFGMLDEARNPTLGLGAELGFRNIKGSFLNWTTGFRTFDQSLSSGRPEENYFFTRVDKELVSRYSHWMGAAEFAFGKTKNAFHADSVYKKYFEYTNQAIDLWVGYNFGAKQKIESDKPDRLRHFAGARAFYHHFYNVPSFYLSNYNAGFADINGLLLSYTLYKQNFVRTSFIYGFGRYEDVPEGFSASVIGGYTNKEGRRRGYYGLEFEGTDFARFGFFTNYVAKLGGFSNGSRIEDVDVLLGVNHFTKLRQLGPLWRNRHFLSVYFTKQVNSRLNPPLYLNSKYGLSYFRNDSIFAQTRTTVKLETVFYNLYKLLGFRFAPFVFADMSFVQPLNGVFSKTAGYSGVGAGIRTRNENLTIGTMELRGYYFPRPTSTMKGFRIDFTTRLRFKYNSNFIRRPDFILAN